MFVPDTQLVINELHIEAQLARIARVELRSLQLDHHVTQLLNVKEQKLDEEVITIDVEMDLAAYKPEPGTKLTEGLDDAIDQPLLKFSLSCV